MWPRNASASNRSNPETTRARAQPGSRLHPVVAPLARTAQTQCLRLCGHLLGRARARAGVVALVVRNRRREVHGVAGGQTVVGGTTDGERVGTAAPRVAAVGPLVTRALGAELHAGRRGRCAGAGRTWDHVSGRIRVTR